MNELFDIQVQIPVNTGLKNNEKQQILQKLIELLDESVTNIQTESHYSEKRSAEEHLALILGISVSANILTIVNSVLNISQNIGKKNEKSSVFLKQKDGKYIKIDEDMTPDEVINKLKNEKRE